MNRRGVLTIEDFIHWFPGENQNKFLTSKEIQNEKVVASLFSAFDEFRIRDNTIDFEEWARALSGTNIYALLIAVMARGTFEEKVQCKCFYSF